MASRFRSRRAFAGCFNCNGESGLPRAAPNSIRCTASRCKTALTKKQAQERAEQDPIAAITDPAAAVGERMPDSMWVNELS